MKAPWPMDTDQPDTLVLGLTAHHLLLATPGIVLFVVGILLTLSHAIPKWAGVTSLVLVGAMSVGLVIDNPDGMTWDRWLLALLRFRRGPRSGVLADHLGAPPSWVRTGGPAAGRLNLPWGAPVEGGIPLGKDKARGKLGHALALRLSPLDHTAMGEDAVAQVVSALETWLTSLDCDAQVVVRSRPLDLSRRIAAVEAQASKAHQPTLKAIASRRAESLRQVAAGRPQHLRAWIVLRYRDRDGLADRARRCAELLAGAGLTATPVGPAAMAELLGGRGLAKSGAAPGCPAGWPDEIERVDHEVLRVGPRYCLTLRAVAYPPSVEPGWLAPVLAGGADLDLAVHVSPEDPAVATSVLRRQFGRMRSTEAAQSAGGDLADARIAGAANDAERLHQAVGSNDTRTFRAGLYLTVWGEDPDAAMAAAEEVTAKATGKLLDLRPVIFAPVDAWIGTLPLALDLVRQTWRADTQALAAALPVWTGEVESDPTGSLAGYHAVSGAPVFIDRFRLDARRSNAHKLSVAPSGRGKSFEIKQEIASLLLEGVGVRVIDLENEYVRLAEALDGTVVHFGAGGARINPLELAEPGAPEAVRSQALFVEALVSTLLGELDAEDEAQIARAILACYELAGITADPATHGRTPPQMADLHAALEEAGAPRLADRLDAWVFGAHAGLLSGQTTIRPKGDLVVWALGDLPGENERLLAAAVLLAVHATWTEIARKDHRRRVVILDEAWRIWETSAAAGRVLEGLARRLAKGARKYSAGLTNATQDLAEFAATALGRAILNNSAIKWLPGQEAGALPAIASTFGLTEAETKFLGSCSRGQGLTLAGRQRVRLEVRAVPEEHRLATSDPDEVARIDAEELTSAADGVVAAWVACAAGAGGDAGAVATGKALGDLEAQEPARECLACRHQVVAVEGEWMGGHASASAELTWSDGHRTWGELVRLSLVRRGRHWLVAEAVRVGGEAR